jgi:hypothetical protein
MKKALPLDRFAARNMASVIKTAAWAKVVESHQRVADDVLRAVAFFQGDQSQK